MKTFLLIDDHIVVRSGIRSILLEIFAPCEIHEAGDGEEALEILKHHNYDLIMMDVQMPKTDSLGLMEYIHVKYPETKVLIFSMSPEKIYAKRFLKAGAKGFLSKEADLDEVKKAISMVLVNRVYLSEAIASSFVEDSYSGKPGNPFETLSVREFEIMSLLLGGNTVSDISKSLNLQVSTVGTHKARIFEKLNVGNLLELKELSNSYHM